LTDIFIFVRHALHQHDMIFKNLLWGIFFLLYCSQAEGQGSFKPKLKPVSGRSNLGKEISHYSFKTYGGLTQFYGELNEQDMQGMLGINLSRDINQKVSFSLGYTIGRLGGENGDFFKSYFVTKYNTTEFLAKWNVTEQFRGRKRGDCDFSIYGGVGLMVFRANAFDLDTDELVRFTNSVQSARNPLFLKWGTPKGPAGIRNTREGILPVGMALDYELLERWQIGLDCRFYFVRTDKADATSGLRLINPEESTSYSDTPNDKFSLLAVSITHRFGKRPR